MSEQQLYHAYYSAKMAEQAGTSIYAREDGLTIEVTGVVQVGSDFKYGWDDLEDHGIVVRFVRTGRPNPHPSQWAKGFYDE